MSGEEGGGDAIHRIEEVVWQEEKRKVAGNPQESCEGGRGKRNKTEVARRLLLWHAHNRLSLKSYL